MDIEETNKNVDWSKFILPGSIILAAILISVSVIYSNGGFAGLANLRNASMGTISKPVEVSADDDAFLGDKDAPVTVIEFSDFQCPFCRAFWKDTLPMLKSQYIDTGKVKFVYRDFPLQFHSGAMPAAQAAECAEEQEKYWEMHDKIFAEQDKQGTGTIQFGVADLKKWAIQIGLNASKFNACLNSGKYLSEAENDYKDGSAAGTNGTPSIFVNGQIIVGAQPFSAFKSLIDSELNK